MVAVALNVGLSRDWIALGRELGGRAAAPAVVEGVLILGGSLLAGGVTGAAVVVGLGYGIALVVSIALNRPPADPAGEPRRQVGPDAWILLSYLAGQVTSTIDAPLLGALDGAVAAGIYGAIYRLPNAWIALLSALVGGTLPTFTRAQEDGPAAVHALRRRALRISGAASLLMVVSAPVAYVAVPIVFGHQYDLGRWPVVVLIMANAVITLSAPLHVLAVTEGNDRRYAEIVGAGALLNVALNLALIPPFGIVGAATATLLAQILIAGLLWHVGAPPATADP
jgi:O-antigen/teichoic acid export membrane protein